jgi:uncharacterized repeat protein (TIGR01451 family)
VGPVAVGTPQTLVIQATVTSAGAETNTAVIEHADQFDPNTGNNTASVTETPQQSDLALAKTVSNGAPNVGDTITYTVTLSDTGPDAATGVAVTDLLPAGLTFVSATPSQGSYTAGTGLWSVGTVAVGTPQTLLIQASVTSPGAQTNTATITHADQFDPVTSNDTSSVVTTPQQADLALTKAVSDATPNVGDTITYTVTLSDTGPDAATGVAVTDLLPAGLALVSATPSQGTYDQGTGLWSVGTVVLGSPQTLVIQATITTANPLTNTATISRSDQFDPVTGNNTASVAETPQQADLALSKSVSDATPNVGDTITYTVTLTDQGPDPATNVQVTDLLPAGVTIVSATPSQGTYSSSTGLWIVGTVHPTGSQTLAIQATVVSASPSTNTATISQADQFDPDTSNNTADVTAKPQHADLSVSKTVSDAAPNVGDTISFTLGLRDNGPSAATDVQVTDLLPAGLAFVSATASQGSYDRVMGVWSAGTVDVAGGLRTLVIQATVVSTVVQTNSAKITHADQFDPNTGNNTAAATETPQHADLVLAKSVDNPTPNVGDTITYTITLADNGPDAATNVQVTDLLPTGRTFVSATPSQGTYDSATGLWTVGTVDTTGPRTLVIRATVASSTSAVNTATITHSDQFDPVTNNNTATTSTKPEQADLFVTKTVSDSAPNVGDTISYTVTLSDNGPDAASNISLHDALPVGLSFVSALPNQGTYDAKSGTWTVGNVPSGSSAVLTIQATVDSAGATTNTATITHSDQFDPNAGNDTASAAVTPQQADVVVTKTVSDTTPNLGDTISYTVTAQDSGPDAATGVTVQDLLPAGLTFVSAVPSRGTYNAVTGTWTIGTVDPSTAETLVIKATITSANPTTNTATITHADQFDPDPGDNTASVVVTPQRADLALVKMVSDATPNVGDTIRYTITLIDQGPDAATSVLVTDLLPAGLAFVSATPSQGTYDASSGLWTVGTVNAVSPETLVIQAMVESAIAETNTARITHSDQFDSDTTNNTASVSEAPRRADLALAKTISNATPNVGDMVSYTVTLSDKGPDTATDVQVTDMLPSGISFVSATPSQGTYDAATGFWVAGTVEVGAPQTLVIQAIMNSPDPEANTAAITHADQFDPVTANNTATVTVTPQQADLAVSKTVNDPTPNVGDTISFTVTLGNSGPNDATNVQITDLLPAGLTFVSATPSQGTYNAASGVWGVGRVNTTVPQTLVIQAKVVGSNSQTNTATITHADQFDPNAGDDTASATETPQHADLVLAKSVDNPTPNVGDTITYTIALADNGPDAATNVQVTDLLPAGRTFVSATPSQGTYDPVTGVWTIGTVDTTAPRSLLIRATVTSSTSTVNTATITHSDQFDPATTNNTATTSTKPEQADLFVTKTVSNASPNVGDTIAYTVTLTDNGPDAATNVSLRDALPVGLSFMTALPSQGTYDATSGTWIVGSVASGSSAALTIQATVAAAGATTNTATITHSDQFDPNAGNNTASMGVTPQRADLVMTKTVSDTTPNVGDTISYTVTARDVGPDTATGVIVQDLLPSGMAFVSATPSRGTYNAVTGAWTIGTVDPSTAETLAIEATVTSANPSTNTATINHADQFDPGTGNNSSSVVVTPQQADLALAKAVSDPAPNVGDTISYTVALSDQGPDTATGVEVTDLLPAGLTFISATPSEGSYDAGTGLWNVGTVNVGSAQTLVIQAMVTSPNARTNTATMTHADQFDPVTTNDTASVTETPQLADLALNKTISDPAPNVGSTATFTVTLSDTGPDVATHALVTDLLPAGLSFVSATSSQGMYDPTTGLWTVGTVAVGAPQTLVIQATVTSADPQTNTVTVTHSDQFDPNTSNNAASVLETPEHADLVLAKFVSNPTPNVGDTISFTVTLGNNGPNSATNIQISDLLPAGLSFVADTASQGSYDATTGLWTVGTLNTGPPASLVIEATVVSASPQSNTAAIAYADQFDPNTTNDTASVLETPQQSDLTITKTTSDPTPNVGDTVRYTVTLTDNGPDAATSAQVTDLLPAGLTFVSATPSQGTYDSKTGLWTVGTVAVGSPETLVIQATVNSANSNTNTATITHSDQYDPDPGNNTATAPTSPQQADLVLTKTVDNPAPNVGGTVTFTVTIGDVGPSNATNVQITDVLPVGLTLVSATPSQGSYSVGTGLWTVGTVNVGSPQTLVIQATVVSPSAQTNAATITHADQLDPNTGNDSAGVTETPQQSDLALAKSVSNPTPNVGDNISYTVTLSNTGPDPATGVQVTDLLPVGLTFVSASPSQGAYDGGTGLWSLGTVSVGSPQTLVIDATVTSPNPQTNTATITHTDQYDPETANDTTSIVATPQQANLALAKTVSNTSPNVEDTIRYTVTLIDTGPDAATDVRVTDLLPAGLTFVSATPSQGTYDSGTGRWTLGTVTTTAPQTLVIDAKVTSPNPQTNTATIVHTDQFDPDTNNNTTSTTETPLRADLALTKTTTDPTPNVGDLVTYTITLADIGPDAATNAEVTDLLPAGLDFVSATPSQGNYDPTTGLWAAGTVNVGSPQTLVILASVTSPDPKTNTAAIIHADQFDPSTANNTAGATLTPQQADLALNKAVSNSTPNVGDIIAFTVTLANNGPSDATNVQVTDALPAGLNFVSDTSSQGTYDATTGLWMVGTVDTGAPVTLVIHAKVVSPDSQTNTAAIRYADQFDPSTVNDTANVSETPQRADLALTKTTSNPIPNVGDTVTYTVTLTDTGPDAATNAQVTDLLPAGLTFVSATPSQGTYDSKTGLWTVGTVAVGSPQTLVLQATVTSANSNTNTATITHSDQFDPAPGNNTATAPTSPQQADLVLTKTVDNPAPNFGGTVTFTISLSDVGPNSATNVQVTDLLPAGLTLVSAVPSRGTYNPSNGLWFVGTVDTTSPQTLKIVASVVSPTGLSNTATITHADQFDPVASNNAASAIVTVPQAELGLTKTVNNTAPNVGDTISYTLTLTNSGPDTATDVQATDPLPAGLAFVSAAPSQGVYNPASGVWSVGTVAVGTPETLVIQTRVVSPNVGANTAAITHSAQFDPNLSDNLASAAVKPQQAALAIAKTVNDPAPSVGETISYTVTITNHGPNAATNVQATDLLPAGLAFVSAATSQGSYNPLSGAWSVGTIGVGVRETLIVQARVLAPGAQGNVATITHSDQFDLSSSDSTASAVVNAVVLVPPTVTSLVRYGFHSQPTSLVLSFSSAMDASPAQDPNNYTLRPIGMYGHLGHRILITSANYNPVTETVTLHPARRLYLYRRYQLEVNGTPPAGLTGSNDVPLDGSGKGVPGTDYVTTFGRSALAGSSRGIPLHGNATIHHASADHRISSPSPQRVSRRTPERLPQHIQPNAKRGEFVRPEAAAVDVVLETIFPRTDRHARHREESAHRG